MKLFQKFQEAPVTRLGDDVSVLASVPQACRAQAGSAEFGNYEEQLISRTALDTFDMHGSTW